MEPKEKIIFLIFFLFFIYCCYSNKDYIKFLTSIDLRACFNDNKCRNDLKSFNIAKNN